MTEHFDDLETRPHALREAALRTALAHQVAHARAHAPYYAERLRAVETGALLGPDWRAALAQLPVTRKAELAAVQRTMPPLGGLNATPLTGLRHVYQSPGPLHEPDGQGPDWWRTARAMFAAGFRQGDLVYNTFSYHFTPAGMMMESGAHRLGCCVFPAGVGQTEAQLQALAQLQPQAYAGTPSFLKILLDKAVERGDAWTIARALVSGEALPAALRAAFEAQGIVVRQMYGTADLGLIAYESAGADGWVVDEGVLVEIVEPGGTAPVPEGEIGEVVVTVLANPDYPLIRFATGDLSAIVPGSGERRSPCGRTNIRLRGWLGRADQSAKVRGMFVHPDQIAEVVRRHPALRTARLIVSGEPGADVMTLHCVLTEDGPGIAADASVLGAQIAASLREVTRLKGEVRIVPPGTLPEDGRLIEDVRRQD